MTCDSFKNPLYYIAALNSFSQPPYPIYSWTGYNFSKNFSIYSNLLTIVLPQWIYDKIYTVWGSSYIAVAKIELRANDWSTQELPVNIFKSDNMIGIQTIEGITLTSDRYFRIQFDLLIDNE